MLIRYILMTNLYNILAMMQSLSGMVQVLPLAGAGFILRPEPAPLERTGRPKCGAGSDNILEPAPFVPGTCATGMPPEAISAKEALHNQLHPEPALGGLFHNLPA